MPDRRDGATTQPLPTFKPPRTERGPLRRLAIVDAVAWAVSAALVAAQYTAAANQAPRLVRGAVWSTACLCLVTAALCLLAIAASGIAAIAVRLARAAEERRRILYAGAVSALADERRHFQSLAGQAAGIGERAGVSQGRVLGMAAARSARWDRHGA